jgi:hypothetical protein
MTGPTVSFRNSFAKAPMRPFTYLHIEMHCVLSGAYSYARHSGKLDRHKGLLTSFPKQQAKKVLGGFDVQLDVLLASTEVVITS